LLTGCANGVNSDDGAAASSVTATPAQRFPLDEYLDSIVGTHLSNEARIQQWEQQNQRRIELVTQCMHDAGFEYDDNNIPGLVRFGGTGPELADSRPLDNRNWVSQYGYQIVSRDRTSIDFDGVFPEHDLTETELAAFHRTLSGPPCEEWGEVDRIGCSTPTDWTRREIAEMQGCEGQAQLQIWDESPTGLSYSDEFASLFEAIEYFQVEFRRVIGDEEIDWAACMANNGHPGFERRENEDVFSFWSLPERQIVDADWSIVTRPGNPTLANSPALQELLEQEINLALADLDCRTAVDYRARQTARRIAAETQFINDHQPELAALRDAAEQRG